MTRRPAAIAAVVLLLPALPAATAAAAKPKPKPPKLDGTYSGPTSQTSPTPTYSRPRPQPRATVVVSGSKTAMVSSFTFDYVATCPDGKYYQTTVERSGRLGIRRGTWGGTFRYVPDNIDGAFSGEVTYRVVGRFRNRTIAQGTFQATLVVRDADTGSVVERCRTPAVSWTARRVGQQSGS